MTNVHRHTVDDEHLNFSSLDTLDHADAAEHIAVRSESSGNSSSSTTNEQSVLCRVNNTSKANRNPTFGTVGRRPVVSQHSTNATVMAAKKPMAPKPPVPPNIVVISNTSTTNTNHKTDSLQRLSNGHYSGPNNVIKSPCVNNIYIETFSNHHKNGSTAGNNNVLVSSANSPANKSNNYHHGHYHYHHHHHPTPHYFGMTKGAPIPDPAIPNGHYHAAESQLMNLETTEL